MKKLFKNITVKFRSMDGLTKAFLILFILLALATSITAFNTVRNLTKTMTILDLPGAPILEALGVGQGPSVSQPSAATPEPWDGKSRVTILVLGLDFRDWQAGEVPRSDTMIMISIDPVSKTASMLSLPRDLWVNIPGFDYGRINEAYLNGAAFNLPGGGAELARQTVEQFIGVPIQYYAVIEFQAFVDFINEIDGVQVQPDQYVCVSEYCGSDADKLQPGVSYTLDGKSALAYIRERKTQEGDVDRARRQQEVILSIRNRILKYQNIPDLIGKAPALYQDLSSGISTNMSLQDAIQLGLLALQLDANNIKRGIINFDMVIPTRSPDNEAILKPITDKIRVLRDELFATTGSKGPLASPSEGSTLVRDEAARLVIWNGGIDAGLVDRTAQYLRDQGINVVQIADAGSYHAASRIDIFNGKPHTVDYLAGLMNVASANIWNAYDPSSGADIRITLGGDWVNNGVIQ